MHKALTSCTINRLIARPIYFINPTCACTVRVKYVSDTVRIINRNKSTNAMNVFNCDTKPSIANITSF